MERQPAEFRRSCRKIEIPSVKRLNASLMWSPFQIILPFRFRRMTSSAPFTMATLKTCFNSGSRISSSAGLNLASICHSAPGNGSGEIPFPHHIGDAIGSPAATHPLDVFLESAHSVATLLRGLAEYVLKNI